MVQNNNNKISKKSDPLLKKIFKSDGSWFSALIKKNIYMELFSGTCNSLAGKPACPSAYWLCLKVCSMNCLKAIFSVLKQFFLSWRVKWPKVGSWSLRKLQFHASTWLLYTKVSYSSNVLYSKCFFCYLQGIFKNTLISL